MLVTLKRDTLMITTPTVLILGAGASLPYGYPNGSDLVTAILQNISGKTHNDLLHDGLHFDRTHLDTFYHQLSTSAITTIDEFLLHHPEHRDLGRLLIALCLIPQETPSLLWQDTGTPNANWYKHCLFPAIKTDSLSDFHNNQLSIITYNYDRSLEQFLLQSLTSTYIIEGDDTPVQVQLNQIPIIHLHGHLNSLSERPYGTARLDAAILQQAASKIEIIHEVDHNNDRFNQARQLLDHAQRIYFIGFGYHRLNLTNLALSSLSSWDNATIIGTVYGFRTRQLNDLQARTDNKITFHNMHILDFFHELDLLT